MTSSILDPFIIFSIPYDYVTCNCDIYDHSVTSITLLLHSFLTLSSSNKFKIKSNKQSLLFLTLI